MAETTSAGAEIFQNFWLKKAAEAQHVPANFDAGTLLEKMRPAVSELSNLFTTERPSDGRFRDYMSDAKLLAAYGLFFFPQSFARANFAVRRLIEIYAWRPDDDVRPLRVLDLGSGASPCGFAAALALRAAFPQREIVITAMDRSRAAIFAAQEIAGTLFPADKKISVEALPSDFKKFSPRKSALPPQDLILLGWSLNEAVPPPLDAVPFLKNLAPLLETSGALVVLEPALKMTAERLQRASDFFAAHAGEPYFRLAPELGNHACPLLREGIFWNHEVRKWTPPESLEFLNRTLFRDIGVLKFSWCALGKTAGKIFEIPDGATEIVRLISPPETTKTCLRFSSVNPRGEKISIEIPARGLSKNELKKFASEWERGDIAIVTGTLEPIGAPGHFRLAGTTQIKAFPQKNADFSGARN